MFLRPKESRMDPTVLGPLCKYCRAIPFATLPSEEEQALGHQPSLQASRTSAASCRLCALILEALFHVRQTVNDKHRGITDGGWSSSDPTYSLPDGRKVMATSSLGHYSVS